MSNQEEPEYLENGERFTGLDHAAIVDNGDFVAFTIKTLGEKELRVYCELAELGNIFAFLGELARQAGLERNAPKPPSSGSYNYLAPIPSQGIGFQAGQNLNETILVVRLSGFDMGFSVPSNALASMSDELVRIARTLSASGDQIQ